MARPSLSGARSARRVGNTSTRICSTSITCARRELSALPSRRARLVMLALPTLASAGKIWLHSRRTISSTSSTAKPCVLRAYSVISRMLALPFLQPITLARSITGMIWPRTFTAPRMWAPASATCVTGGMTMISRTLNTLMPNSSRWLRCDSPRRNSSSSKRLLFVRLVRSSTSCCDIVFPLLHAMWR